jgi:2,3-bisphosphoglycerate-independent phosphoglycerate mutase
MKYVVVVGDGMADYPIPELGNMTPLQAAHKPNMDAIAAKGRNGLLRTVPEDSNPGNTFDSGIRFHAVLHGQRSL